MISRPAMIVLALPALVACRSVDGEYWPGCPAFAGDRIELHDGAVTWDRFSDEVRPDAADNPADANPGYPREGRYTLSGNMLEIRLDGEEQARHFVVHEDAGEIVLLDAAQQAGLTATGVADRCALTRVGSR